MRKKKKNRPTTIIRDRRLEDKEVIAKPSLEVTGLMEEIVIPAPPEYNSINLEMMGDRMLIQPFPTATKIGSLWTPDNREIDIDKGRVCAIGPDVKNIKVGDIVCKMSGLGQSLVDDKGMNYIFLPENAAIAVDTSFTGKIDQCNHRNCNRFRSDTPNHCDGVANVLVCKDYIKHNHSEPKEETIE